jgi:AcrR family transcriptional regulator
VVVAPESRAEQPRSRKGTQTRIRLVNAAKLVFERDGFLDARIVDIAQTAQLAPGSFYHYFDPKEQISGRSPRPRRNG